MTPLALKNNARLCLQRASYDPRKLTLFFSGIVLGSGFLSLVVSYVLSLMMKDTGGLSGLDTRAILETAAMVVDILVQILTPLLTMGFLHCTILMARQKDARPKDLNMGPRRWGTILCNSLFQSLIFLCLAYVALQLGSIIFTFLPGSEAALSLVSSLATDTTVLEGNITDTQLAEMLQALAPAYIIAGVLFLAALIPVSYRLRLSLYRVMDEKRTGPVKASLQSMKLMKGNGLALFKLDLSFWWYYAIQGALWAGMLFLSQLPQVSDLVYLLAYGVYSAVILGLEYKFLAYIQTTYAVFYDTVLEAASQPEHPQLPKNE